jgi:DNA-binding CsgD family transcriptional regulator
LARSTTSSSLPLMTAWSMYSENPFAISSVMAGGISSSVRFTTASTDHVRQSVEAVAHDAVNALSRGHDTFHFKQSAAGQSGNADSSPRGIGLAEVFGHDVVHVREVRDIPSSVRAIKAGALDFLTKPFSGPALLGLVHAAIDQDRERRARRAGRDSLQRRYDSLTPREREVLPLVVGGLLNKQAAAHLGISEITLQIHRTNVMRKMAAQSLADLVRMAGALEIPVTLARRS